MKELFLFIASLLSFVFSIPGTNALRYFLGFVLLISASFMVFRKREIFFGLLSNFAFKRILQLLAAITIYILIHNILISHEIMWSMQAFKGHWIVPLLFFGVGILLGTLSQLSNYYDHRNLVTAIFIGMFLHVLYIDLVAINKLTQEDYLITYYGGITTSPVMANYLTNALFTISIGELISRLKGCSKVLQISNTVLYIVIASLLFSVVIEGVRHGVIELLVVSIISASLFLYKNNSFSKNIKLVLSALIIVMMTLPLIYSMNYDKRWTKLLETIPIAFETETHLFWQDHKKPIPKFDDGSDVSGSNYLRLAWAKKGVEYIIKNPIGIGFGRNAFGHAIQMYEGVDSARGYHAHSSLIDLTIGAGLAFLFLWMLFIIYIVVYFFKSYRENPNFYAITGLLFTSAFFLRSIVDSNMRDHVFQQFFFFLGVLLALQVFMQLKKSESA